MMKKTLTFMVMDPPAPPSMGARIIIGTTITS